MTLAQSASSHLDGPWTTRRLLAWTTERFEQRNIDSPRLSAEMLLSHVLSVPRLHLYMESDRPASPQEREQFRALVKRALDHEPVDYLVGHSPFFGLDFQVDSRVLIPRPSTEVIIETVLQRERSIERDQPGRILDLCTGSGAIAVSLAHHLPNAQVVATDISEDALAVAKTNADKHGVTDRIVWAQGDLFDALSQDHREAGFDYVLSNPPYISDEEWEAVEPNVKNYEPTLALRAGSDGMSIIGPLLEQAEQWLVCKGVENATSSGAGLPGAGVPGVLMVEHAASQGQVTREFLQGQTVWQNIETLFDHERLERVLFATRAPE